MANLGTYLRGIDPILVKDNRTSEKVVEEVMAYFYNPRDISSNLAKTVRVCMTKKFQEMWKVVHLTNESNILRMIFLQFLSYFFSSRFYELIRALKQSFINNNIWNYYFADGAGFTNYKKLLLSPAFANESGSKYYHLLESESE